MVWQVATSWILFVRKPSQIGYANTQIETMAETPRKQSLLWAGCCVGYQRTWFVDSLKKFTSRKGQRKDQGKSSEP